jgi:hypothetical protein
VRTGIMKAYFTFGRKAVLLCDLLAFDHLFLHYLYSVAHKKYKNCKNERKLDACTIFAVCFLTLLYV